MYWSTPRWSRFNTTGTDRHCRGGQRTRCALRRWTAQPSLTSVFHHQEEPTQLQLLVPQSTWVQVRSTQVPSPFKPTLPNPIRRLRGIHVQEFSFLVPHISTRVRTRAGHTTPCCILPSSQYFFGSVAVMKICSSGVFHLSRPIYIYVGQQSKYLKYATSLFRTLLTTSPNFKVCLELSCIYLCKKNRHVLAWMVEYTPTLTPFFFNINHLSINGDLASTTQGKRTDWRSWITNGKPTWHRNTHTMGQNQLPLHLQNST
jgi:hypothetical protein